MADNNPAAATLLEILLELASICTKLNSNLSPDPTLMLRRDVLLAKANELGMPLNSQQVEKLGQRKPVQSHSGLDSRRHTEGDPSDIPLRNLA